MKQEILFIFDYDGTLIDTDIAFAKKSVEILMDAGLKMTFEEMSGALAGASSLDKISKAAQNAHKTLPSNTILELREQLRAAKKGLYSGQSLSVYPGVEQLLTRLKQYGFKYCIGSNNHLENMNMSLSFTETDLGRLIPQNQRFCGNTLIKEGKITALKPNPDTFTYSADYNHINYENCIVIGNSIQDAQAAASAGMKFIGFKCPELSTPDNINDLKDNGAIDVFRSFSDLERLLFDDIFALLGNENRPRKIAVPSPQQIKPPARYLAIP